MKNHHPPKFYESDTLLVKEKYKSSRFYKLFPLNKRPLKTQKSNKRSGISIITFTVNLSSLLLHE